MNKEKETLKSSKINNVTFSIVIAIVSIMLGIVISVATLTNSYSELNKEHNDHLLSLVWSTDKNLDDLLAYCRLELRKDCVKYGGRTMEALLEGVAGSRTLDTSKYDEVVILEDHQIVMSLDNKIDSLTFNGKYSHDEPCLCVDDNGDTYLATIEPTGIGDSDLATLQRLDKFFDKFVGKELTDYYWLALYDVEEGICIQDDVTQPLVKNITYEAAQSRNDGVTIMAESEKSGEIRFGRYSYKSEASSSGQFIITTLPTSVNDNGYFTIGLSVPTDRYEGILKNIFWRTGICGALILFGLFVIFLIIYRHRQANAAMLADIELLQTRNEELKHMMDMSQDLAHQQQLVQIGTIASSVNHEFSNLLTPVMGYSMLAMEAAGDNDELLDYLEKIYEESSKAKNLVARMLKLSRKAGNIELVQCSPDDLLRKIDVVLASSQPHNVEVIKDYNCPDKVILASEVQIEHVLINIINNAYQAMADAGGLLTISTHMVDDHIEYRIKDTGPGLTAETKEHLFEPFYTTKSDGEGTGLGLAIVKQIVEGHHGRIEVESTIGEGTEFIIIIPIVEESIIVNNSSK